MGIPQSTARVIAPLAFVFDFAAQMYGLLGSPNMQDIHDANLSFFSPQPYFIGAFFFPQQCLQLAWLWKLWTMTAGDEKRLSEKEREEVREMVDYVPVYALGNVCIGVWMFFWTANDLKTSNVFVTINTVAQLLYVFGRLPPMKPKSVPSLLTHAVAKTFAGIGVLDQLHNTSAAYFKGAYAAPSTLTKVLTGVGFGALAAGSDAIFGACLVYDLVALTVGQSGSWRTLLAGYAAGTAAIVGLRNWALYSRNRYQRLSSEEEQTSVDEEA